MTAQLEHVNYTVHDSRKTAAFLCSLFGWETRWQGEAINGGHTVHVGTKESYVAVFSPKAPAPSEEDHYVTIGGLNHIAVTVDDIDDMEKRVADMGFVPVNHANYEPGRRFYFHDDDGIEYEVVQYD